DGQSPTIEPSKFFAFDFKEKFARFEFSDVSASIDNDRSIFRAIDHVARYAPIQGKDRQHSYHNAFALAMRGCGALSHQALGTQLHLAGCFFNLPDGLYREAPQIRIDRPNAKQWNVARAAEPSHIHQSLFHQVFDAEEFEIAGLKGRLFKGRPVNRRDLIREELSKRGHHRLRTREPL